jgi:ferredoxin
MSKVTVLFKIGHGIIEQQARIGSRLANVVRKAGISDSDFSECFHKLECGKCIVSASSGFWGSPHLEEENLLSAKGAPANSRCSCQVVVDETFDNQIISIVNNN